jgi:hypothetical protein
VDEGEIRAQVVAFLDRVETRERERHGVGARTGQALQRASLEPSSDAVVEAALVLDVARADTREIVRQAQAEAEQTLEWSRSQGAEIVRRSQRLAADRFGNGGRAWRAS